MTRYLASRLLDSLIALWLVATLTFAVLRLAPGGPFDDDRAWPPEIRANIEAKYGLADPLPMQYFRWISGVATGDWRESFQHMGVPVLELIGEAWRCSAVVGILSLAFAIAFGLAFGSWAALRAGSWVDRVINGLAISAISLPSYLLATLGVLYFSLHLGWLPPALWESPDSWVLPVLTLATRPAALIARVTRSGLIDALSSDYVRTARAKGLGETRVVYKHALKNSLVPVLALLGPITANLLTGSFVVESVFQLPGLGKHFVGSVLNRDYPLAMGVTLVYGALLLAVHLVVDVLYALVDPRIRVAE